MQWEQHTKLRRKAITVTLSPYKQIVRRLLPSSPSIIAAPFSWWHCSWFAIIAHCSLEWHTDEWMSIDQSESSAIPSICPFLIFLFSFFMLIPFFCYSYKHHSAVCSLSCAYCSIMIFHAWNIAVIFVVIPLDDAALVFLTASLNIRCFFCCSLHCHTSHFCSLLPLHWCSERQATHFES